MGLLQDSFDEVLSHELRRCSQEEEQSILSGLDDAIPSIVSSTAASIFDRLRRSKRSQLRVARRGDAHVVEEIRDRWGGPLDQLYLLIAAAVEAAHPPTLWHKISSTSMTFGVLLRLHARACQIAGEVHALLSAGYPDGAMARWRALHEVSVVTHFIYQHGDEMAERYIEHAAITTYRGALTYAEHCSALGFEELGADDIERLRAEREGLVRKYGSSFTEDYGWATSAFSKVPKFVDLEEAVDLGHFRPFYRWASNNVHAGPMGILDTLGLRDDERELILSGKSAIGFADPGQNTAVTLHQITVVLLTSEPNIDSLVLAEVLGRFADAVVESFVAVHRSGEIVAPPAEDQ